MSGYLAPRTLNEALECLSNGQGYVAAGCTDLLAATPLQNLPGPVVDITGIPEITGISNDVQGWRIGAATPWADLRNADLPPAFDGLKQAATQIGSVQIQNSGTIGGNLCNASPAADGMPPLLTLDAQVELASATAGVRRLALADFVTGPRQTELRVGEMMTALHIPASAGAGTAGFVKLGARKYMVISIAMAAARVVVEHGVIRDISISIGACGPVAKRLKTLENALVGQSINTVSELISLPLITPDISPIDDIRANKEYRIEAAFEVIQRAVQQALEAGR